uniref:TBC1 domain family member 4 n=1 Tax=Esox lucius TaxID=8010 RepID=A0A6Q2Z7X9_ESOLU
MGCFKAVFILKAQGAWTLSSTWRFYSKICLFLRAPFLTIFPVLVGHHPLRLTSWYQSCVKLFPPSQVPEIISALHPLQRFEVLFCGRVTVAHKKAPPALIDECIEKFSQSRGTEGGAKPVSSGGFVSGLRRALTFPLALNGKPGDEEQDAVREGGQDRGREWAPAGERPMFFKRDPSFPCLEALDENGLSPELHTPPGDPRAAGVQPASLQENRTMLFMVGRSQIFLVSPDTKKVSIEKSFREISFCSQGIRHVDHFGFICRETVEGGSCTFICYVFQCTDEALVDEIMLTLKQAFSVAPIIIMNKVHFQNILFIKKKRVYCLILYHFFTVMHCLPPSLFFTLFSSLILSHLGLSFPVPFSISERGDSSLEGRVLSLSQGGAVGGGDRPLGVVPEERKRRGQADLRELWRKAILQQILLLRMERENNKIQASESKRLRLDYEEITPCLKDVTLVWEGMLGTPARSTVKFNRDTIHTAVGQGVPRQFRGEVWKFLSEQYLLSQTVPSRTPANNTPYKELLKQLTSQQHAILIDLGRTFPTHPYFQAQLGAGQLSLYNLLKAYSLLDPEVGYCQGLSFIAGVLLLHMGEEEAFNMLKFLMYDMGLRKQYRPDMIILQIQMYQLSRLLHDYHRDLYVHLEQQEIGPSLYAAPWFLTAFASHFPLGFVARVFDMLFLQGAEVIFKVSLSLLGSHKPLILQHDSLETIVDFIKTTLPNLGLVQMEKTINQVCEMDISKQLQAYEVEYHVLQDELCDMPAHLNQSQRAAQLERTNQSLRQQNLDLLEELQVNKLTCGHTHTHTLSLQPWVELVCFCRFPRPVCVAWRAVLKASSNQRGS